MANSNTGGAAGNSFGATPSEGLVNEHEAARLLGLSVKTLRRWRWAGKGPNFVKIGSAVRYEPSELSAVITAGRRKSTSDPGPEAA